MEPGTLVGTAENDRTSSTATLYINVVRMPSSFRRNEGQSRFEGIQRVAEAVRVR